MAQVLTIDEESFQSDVLASDLPVLVDFTAAWCGPCRVLEPVIERLAVEHAGRVRVGTVDVDHAPVLARRFGIRGVPTVIAFRAGREVGRHAGTCRAETLLALLSPAHEPARSW